MPKIRLFTITKEVFLRRIPLNARQKIRIMQCILLDGIQALRCHTGLSGTLGEKDGELKDSCISRSIKNFQNQGCVSAVVN